MSTPLLYRQLQEQLSQFIQPKDKRHLSVEERKRCRHLIVRE